MKKPSSNFLSRMRSPRKSSNASSPGDDDPSSSRKQPHKDSSSRKQLLKDQYTAYSEKKDYDRHVKEVERQNRKNQEKQSKAEAWLIKKGFTKEEAKRNAAATVLQVYTALCNLPSRCHIYYSVRMGSMVCTPLYHRALSRRALMRVTLPGRHPCAAEEFEAGAASRSAQRSTRRKKT